MILGGPVIALYGRRFFPWVIAGIVSISFLLGFLVFCSVAGFMETNVGMSISIGGSFLVSGLSGWFVMQTVWIAVGILGLIGGFFLGTMVYSVFLVSLGWGALWAMMTLSLIFAILGGLLSFRFSK